MFVIQNIHHGYCVGPGAFGSRQAACDWLFRRCGSPADLFNWRIVPA
mgnify:FL=1